MAGKWLPGFVPGPASSILAVHAALVRTSQSPDSGSIVIFSGNNFVREEHEQHRVDRTRLFDCSTHALTALKSPESAQGMEPPDLFCCGHSMLEDGKVLVIGGTHIFGLGGPDEGGFHHGHWPGLDTTFLFDPQSLKWIEADRMPPPLTQGPYTGGRWYPTAVTLPEGTALAMSGHPDQGDIRHNNNTPGVFRANRPRGSQWHVFPIPSQMFELGREEDGDREDREYPRALGIPGGVVFCSTPLAPASSMFATQMQVLDPKTGARAFVGMSPAVSRTGRTPFLPGAEAIYNSYFGTSVILPLLPENGYRARVLLFGGQKAWIVELEPIVSAVRSNSIRWNVEELGNLANATPAPPRTLTGKNHTPPLRRHVNSVILPSGEVFFVGGIDPGPVGPDQNPDLDADAVASAEIFGPTRSGDLASASWGWTNVPTGEVQVVPRNYHSVALLLPDGRVWCAGSSKDHGSAEFEPRMQIYEPWYIAEPRPDVFASADTEFGESLDIVHYGHRFNVRVRHNRPIQRFVLVRCGSATHGFNSDQRYVGLTFELQGSNSVYLVTAPPDGGVAPPGLYLLFAVDNRGVPSKGRFITLQWVALPAGRPSSSSSAVSPARGYVEAFWVRPDGMVFTNGRDPHINGGRWNNPIPIAPNPGSADTRSGVAAVSPSPGVVEVFWVRPDGIVFTNARDPGINGGRWNNPVPVAPNPGSADPRSGVAAICPVRGIVEVFWVRPDGMVFTNGREPNINGGRWNNPIPIAPNPGSADPRSGVAAVSSSPGVVEVFWVRPDGMVFTNARDPGINGGRWNNPIPIASSPGSADPRSGVAAVCPARGTVEVFWVRPDGVVFTNARDPGINGGRWNNPIPIAPNPGSGDPRSGVAAVCPARGTVEVFWVRPDGMVFTNAREPDVNGGRWNNPIPIAPNPGSGDPRSGMAAVCPARGTVEVFWVRPDGMVFTNARDPSINGGRWNNPIPIAPNPGSAAIRIV